MSYSKLVGLFVLLIIAALFSCSGGGGSSSDGTGTLSLGLTDASTNEYRAVYITIDEVQVHLGGNESNPNHWLSVKMYDSPLTVNLLELVNGVREELGIVDMPVGSYTQMRLIIGDTPDDPNMPYANFVIDTSNPPNTYELKVPSGPQTGEKIIGGFEINENKTTELILDIDACRSVVKSSGINDKWLLKPTIKVAYPDEYGIITGKVTGSGMVGIEGAIVSAQFFDNSSQDEKDWVNVQASTITDSEGDYQLFVAPGVYHLVAYIDAKDPAIRDIEVDPNEIYDGENFELLDAAGGVGTVQGEISLPGATDDQFATLSFRQTIINTNQMIEIKAVNVLNDSSPVLYNTRLPGGDYRVVSSSVGYNTEMSKFTLTNAGIPLDEIAFTAETP